MYTYIYIYIYVYIRDIMIWISYTCFMCFEKTKTILILTITDLIGCISKVHLTCKAGPIWFQCIWFGATPPWMMISKSTQYKTI